MTTRRAKFNLDDLYSDAEGDDNDGLGGFTHRGRPLEEVDDFQDDIPVTSDDDQNDDRDEQLGKLNDEMVMTMNFGGGRRNPAVPQKDPEERTRKEIFAEIIEKSKAYKAAKFEVKEAAKELTERLDRQFFDILPLLNMSKVKTSTETTTGLDSYEQIAAKLKEQVRAQPAHVILGEREQARMRKSKL